MLTGGRRREVARGLKYRRAVTSPACPCWKPPQNKAWANPLRVKGDALSQERRLSWSGNTPSPMKKSYTVMESWRRTKWKSTL